MFNLYNRIELICREAGINITQMCKLIDISRSIMSELKAGRTVSLSADTLDKIQKYFNIPNAYLRNSPPFDMWEKINDDRDGFFYYIEISERELSEIWKIDKKNTASAKAVDIISFLSRCVKSATVSHDGEWNVVVYPEYLSVWKNGFLSEETPSNIIPLPSTKEIPLLGTIACGEPILATENIDMYIKVDERIPADFALKCKGDSMINARIFDGDVVYIRQQPDVDDGEIAAVLIGEEATLKRVHKYPNKLVLSPCNPMYDDLIYLNEQLEEIRIIGKAVAFTSLIRQ